MGLDVLGLYEFNLDDEHEVSLDHSAFPSRLLVADLCAQALLGIVAEIHGSTRLKWPNIWRRAALDYIQRLPRVASGTIRI